MDKRAKQAQDALTSDLGCAVAATILLSDWEKYGLSERVAYHFHLTEALAAVPIDRSNPSSSIDHVCGVVRLLECVPTLPIHKLTRSQKKSLRNQIRTFNQTATKIRSEARQYCHEPAYLPLRLNPETRVYFAYESTRIALVVDASPTATSTFGMSSDYTCPLDRFGPMAKLLFQSLIEPIETNQKGGSWVTELAVTVLAVYPQGEPSLLVRDFRVRNVKDAHLLASEIRTWSLQTVEAEIARRLAHKSIPSYYNVESCSRRMSDLTKAGAAVLSILSSSARPMIVVATDGRSISCDSALDIVSDIERADVPVSILDLSSPTSHGRVIKGNEEPVSTNLHDDNGAYFPLHLSDDTEGLYRIVKATGGSFFNMELLEQASTTYAGQVAADSCFLSDNFFAFRRHSIRPNAVQWYCLFVHSPLSPKLNDKVGRLDPPQYLRQRIQNKGSRRAPLDSTAHSSGSRYHQGFSDLLRHSSISASTATGSGLGVGRRYEKAVFATYVINPIRIHGLLLMRVKEGYYAEKYGQSTSEPDKVFILFRLPLDMEVVLYYEVSYKSLSRNHMVGVAHIKIEMSGDPSFLQIVKNDFLRAGVDVSLGGTHQYSIPLCKLLKTIRREDTLQSFLAPNSWKEQLRSPRTPFLRRLETLEYMQCRRHFRRFELDCVCTGLMPYSHEADFLSEFRDLDDGEQELKSALESWASQVITAGIRFVKRMDISGLPSYCVVTLARSPVASRVFTITIYTFGTFGATERLEVLATLKSTINGLQNVRLLEKQIGQYLVGVGGESRKLEMSSNARFLRCQHRWGTWDLVNDPELLPLLMKRRTEIGNFHLLESSETYALFAKITPEADSVSSLLPGAGDLVQYQLQILTDRVVVEIHMESESGEFHSLVKTSTSSEFARMIRSLKKRDQECGRALQSRTLLLNMLDTDETHARIREGNRTVVGSVKRLLAYASITETRLRFFSETRSPANSVLESLTESTLLSGRFKARVGKIMTGEDKTIEPYNNGIWFIVEYDRQTISLLHLPSTDVALKGDDDSFIVMKFFTVNISDLYNRRDDDEDDAEDDHVSEHLCVSELADAIVSYHDRNFVLASYLALQSISSNEHVPFGQVDYNRIIRSLAFVTTSTVVIGGEIESTSSKLVSMLRSIIGVCPDDDKCFYFAGDLSGDNIVDGMDMLSDSSISTDIDLHVDNRSAQGGEETRESLSFSAMDEASQIDEIGGSVVHGVEPLFIKLYVDGRSVSFSDLANISRSASLEAKLSVFSDSDLSLPFPHQRAGAELSRLLDAYVAEQTLERIQGLGSALEESDIRLARRCLRKARGVRIFSQDIYFYSSKTDSMVQGASIQRVDSIKDGFDFLSDEILAVNSIEFIRLSSGVLCSMEKETNSDSLLFWCFVVIKPSGVIVEIFHPGGQNPSLLVVDRVRAVVDGALFRVNQRLLLMKLHESRMASALLITPNQDDDEGGATTPADDVFAAGAFQCECLNTTEFDLFHRCATNPEQVSRNLEATVLHIFSISNRRHVFVYTDEVGSVFYMRLHSRGGGADADGVIELRIYGISEPPKSVTEQLARLLRKRLMNIATDMLSSVLVQNPGYSWKLEDLDYVWSFQEKWKVLGGPVTETNEHLYVIPAEVVDPVMVMLYFRQNICGSTYFNPLRSMDWPPSDVTYDYSETLDFVFYYNFAPSKLDSKFQALSTLTKKGLEFSRKIGSGVAVIELALVNGEGSRLSELDITKSDGMRLSGSNFVQPESFLLAPYEANETNGGNASTAETERLLFAVRITATNMKVDFLHEWIHLTLNQVAATWTMETLLRIKAVNPPSPVINVTTPKQRRIEEISPGLQGFASAMQRCIDLPHPGVLESEHVGVLRSSSLCRVTFEVLENTIFDVLKQETSLDTDFLENTSIIRVSRTDIPAEVKIAKRMNSLTVCSVTLPDKEIIDNPADCPEYICFYCSPEWGEYPSKLPKLFTEVLVHAAGSSSGQSHNHAYVEAFEDLKLKHEKLFRRSFAFLLQVKRNRRHLLTYNWSPQVQKTVVARLQEKERSFEMVAQNTASGLQARALALLSPRARLATRDGQSHVPASHRSQRSSFEDLSRSQSINKEKVESFDSVERSRLEGTRGKPRRAIRPTSIRRPNLIGRSVEGAATHAAAASRERAKSSQFRGVKASSAVGALRRPQTRESGKPPENQTEGKQLTSAHITARPMKLTVSEELTAELTRRSTELPRAVSERRANATILHRLRLEMDLFLNMKPQEMDQYFVLEFLTKMSTPLMCEAFHVPLFPDKILSSFLESLIAAVSNWSPDWQIVTPKSSDTHGFFTLGPIKNVRGCKCLTVLSIQFERCAISPSSAGALFCNGWLMSASRRPKGRRRAYRARYFHSTNMDARDAMGMTLLASDSFEITSAMILNIGGYVAQMLAMSPTSNADLVTVADVMLYLENANPLNHQIRIPQLKYNAFVVHIVLHSYKNHLIDMFSGLQLLNWLHINAKSNNLKVAGDACLMFDEDIRVEGTVSYCMLATDPEQPGRMNLRILCRNNGYNLYDYTVRQGSTVALSIADRVSVEAAGLALQRLQVAATHLRRDDLWNRATLTAEGALLRPAVSSNEIDELIALCTVTTVEPGMVSIVRALGTDSALQRTFLSNEARFQPCRDLSDTRYMMYCSNEDLFLIVEQNPPTSVEIMERVVSPANQSAAIQKYINFIMHIEWREMASD